MRTSAISMPISCEIGRIWLRTSTIISPRCSRGRFEAALP
jgi:hypothetical protein